MSLTLRKPATVSPEAVAAFVGGSEPQPTPATLAPSAPPLRSVPTPTPSRELSSSGGETSAAPSFRRASKAVAQRRTRSARRRTTVYLDVDVATDLAQVLLHKMPDQELSDVVTAAVRDWLAIHK